MKLLWLVLLASCARLPVPPLSEELKKENVLHISFEENRTEDQSGSGNHAMKREGYYSLPAAGGVAQSASALTLSLWVKITDDVKAAQDLMAFSIAGKSPSPLSRASIRLIEGNRFLGFGRSLDQEQPQEVCATLGLQKHRWYHLVAIINYSESTLQLFVDGEVIASQGKPKFHARQTPATPSASASIGAEDDGSASHFKGELAEALAWRRALSALDIKHLYESQKGHFR